jgi:hypothetical protein
MIRSVLTLGLVLSCLLGCDQQGDVEPFGSVSEPFALYGVLDADANVQRLRLEVRRPSIDLPRTPEAALLPDVTVTSGLLQPDSTLTERRVWRQTTVRLPDGTYAAVFEATFRAEAPGRHQITVTRPASGARPVAEYVGRVVLPSAESVYKGALVQTEASYRLPVQWTSARLASLAASHVVCVERLIPEDPEIPAPAGSRFDRYEFEGYVETEPDSGRAYIALSRLLRDARRESEFGDTARVQYIQFRYGVRVQDRGWTGRATDPDQIGGFIGGTDSTDATMVLTNEERETAGFFVPFFGGGC